VEESWDIVAPLQQAWKDRFSIDRYRAGSWDVPDMDELLEGCVGGWHKPH
jgi:glucose-6-phosphate 1-dehydrogenase